MLKQSIDTIITRLDKASYNVSKCIFLNIGIQLESLSSI